MAASHALDPAHHVLDVPYVQDLIRWGGVPCKIGYVTKHMVMLWVVAGLMILLFRYVARRLRQEGGIPKGRLVNACEAVILYVRDKMVIPNLGHHGEPFVPFFLSVFFFVLFSNLAGLIPGSATATGNLMVTGGLSLVVLAVSLVCGMRAQGPLAFWLHIVPSGIVDAKKPALLPIMVPIWGILFLIECVGMVIKHFALMVRLYANMIAGHIVIVSLLALIYVNGFEPSAAGMAVPLAVGIFFLEILVAFLQAYVFTLLSILFVGMAVHPHH